MTGLRTTIAAIFVCLAGIAQAEMQLVMAEEAGCVWCARWDREISEIYPKTSEGKSAPLHRVNIREPLPKGLKFARSLHYTPTFVLMVDGKEVNRIEGYPGEDFFWGLLAQMISAANDVATSG